MISKLSLSVGAENLFQRLAGRLRKTPSFWKKRSPSWPRPIPWAAYGGRYLKRKKRGGASLQGVASGQRQGLSTSVAHAVATLLASGNPTPVSFTTAAKPASWAASSVKYSGQVWIPTGPTSLVR